MFPIIILLDSSALKESLKLDLSANVVFHKNKTEQNKKQLSMENITGNPMSGKKKFSSTLLGSYGWSTN